MEAGKSHNRQPALKQGKKFEPVKNAGKKKRSKSQQKGIFVMENTRLYILRNIKRYAAYAEKLTVLPFHIPMEVGNLRQTLRAVRKGKCIKPVSSVGM